MQFWNDGTYPEVTHADFFRKNQLECVSVKAVVRFLVMHECRSHIEIPVYELENLNLSKM